MESKAWIQVPGLQLILRSSHCSGLDPLTTRHAHPSFRALGPAEEGTCSPWGSLDQWVVQRIATSF